MTAVAHRLTPRPANDFADPLAGLRARLAELAEEDSRLSKVDSAAAEAEEEDARITSALRIVDSADRESFDRWLASGAHGAPPALLVEERARLEQRRSLAAADLRSSAIARGAVAKRSTAIAAEAQTIQTRILRHRADEALRENESRAARIENLISDLGREWAAVEGLKRAAREGLQAANNGGNEAVAGVYQNLVQALDSRRWPDMAWPMVGAVAAAARWHAMLNGGES